MNTDNDPDVLGPQVALLYRNLRPGQIVSILNTCLLTWLGSGHLATEYLIAWSSVALAVALLRLFGDYRYRQLGLAERNAQATLWRKRSIIGACLGGLVWSGGTILFMTAGDPILKLFTAFVMAGMVAGAVQVVAADLTAFRCYAWPVVLAVALCGFSADSMGIAFSLMSLLFLITVTRSARFFNEALHDAIRLEREQAKLASHLAHAREVAERSLRAKTEFLSNISHELRTPMNGIIGIADLLALDAMPEQKELLGHLQLSSDLLMTQINNLIKLSELEAEQVSLSPAPFQCRDLLTRALCRREKDAATKGVAIRCESAPEIPPTLLGDSEYLFNMLDHLIDNAIKFTESGVVSVSASLKQQAGETVWIEFAVSDTGHGMSQDSLKMIEGLMIQADGSSMRRHGGLGVGLAIVRRLTRLMNGDLHIASKPGQGSVFSFTVPLLLPESESPSDTVSA